MGHIMERDEIVQILQAHRHDLIVRYGVQSLALFGSTARGEATSQSDVDLLVEFNRPTGLFGLFELQDYLELLLNCPVDLGTQNSLKPQLRSQVLSECIHVA
jgi:predicted nucleotidyltransferase